MIHYLYRYCIDGERDPSGKHQGRGRSPTIVRSLVKRETPTMYVLSSVRISKKDVDPEEVDINQIPTPHFTSKEKLVEVWGRQLEKDIEEMETRIEVYKINKDMMRYL